MTRVFISSASGTLRPYRQIAIELCYRLGMEPVAMENFYPETAPPLEVCRREVSKSDIFVLLIADRYGDRPPGEDLSYTELEYQWATAKHGTPIVPFIADDRYLAAHVRTHTYAEYRELGDLAKFVEKVRAHHTVKFFNEIETFRNDLYRALEFNRPPDPDRRLTHAQAVTQASWHANRRTLPSAPQPYAIPAYVGGSPFTGRRKELRLLTRWASSAAPVAVVEAIGGTGKSALTWEWFDNHAEAAIPRLAGRFWWSFYDGSASINRFLQQLLGYLTASTAWQVSRIPREELPELVLTELRRRPILLALDGFERLLMAYHQYDPSKVTDTIVEADARADKHSMIDGVGYDFVRALVGTSPSKVIVTTRMAPDALEGPGRSLLPGVYRYRLPGIDDSAVRSLLTKLGVSGGARNIESFFRPLDNHPLLIAIVAGLVRDHRLAPGDFDSWREHQPFSIGAVDLAAKQRHILDAAFQNLDPQTARLLSWLSALSGSVGWRLVQDVNPFGYDSDLSTAEAGAALDAALRDLEARGLLWWDRQANTYDMHPVVRAFSYDRLNATERVTANEQIRDHFAALPPETPNEVTSVEDLQPTITLFRALTGSGNHGRVVSLWNGQLAKPLLVRLGANATVTELLQPYENSTIVILRADLSIALHLAAEHDRGVAVEAGLLAYLLNQPRPELPEIRLSLGRLSTHYRSTGGFALYSKALDFMSQTTAGADVQDLADLLLRRAILAATTGEVEAARSALTRINERSAAERYPWLADDVQYWTLALENWAGNPEVGDRLVDAEQSASDWRMKLRLRLLSFDVSMRHGDLDAALKAAEDVDRLRRVGGQTAISAESAWALAALGRTRDAEATLGQSLARLPRLHPYDRPHQLVARTLSLLGRDEEARQHALQGYRQAWGDGPPFSHRWNLRRAEQLLASLGAPAPVLRASSAATIPHEPRLREWLEARRRTAATQVRPATTPRTTLVDRLQGWLDR
ncbi:DUF4062 domain-containing protein [Cryptosporangium arvum]|uniref:DUF4062 domain-containing protein n=1 Tax=Cryptosporangium arvum TaxID=80871 RepID=UPI0004B26677|nr:DUF4062 domain-containing protein [Cryptosporangium arvum]